MRTWIALLLAMTLSAAIGHLAYETWGMAGLVPAVVIALGLGWVAGTITEH